MIEYMVPAGAYVKAKGLLLVPSAEMCTTSSTDSESILVEIKPDTVKVGQNECNEDEDQCMSELCNNYIINLFSRKEKEDNLHG